MMTLKHVHYFLNNAYSVSTSSQELSTVKVNFLASRTFRRQNITCCDSKFEMDHLWW